jgi:hypothetical protein
MLAQLLVTIATSLAPVGPQKDMAPEPKAPPALAQSEQDSIAEEAAGYISFIAAGIQDRREAGETSATAQMQDEAYANGKHSRRFSIIVWVICAYFQKQGVVVTLEAAGDASIAHFSWKKEAPMD